LEAALLPIKHRRLRYLHSPAANVDLLTCSTGLRNAKPRDLVYGLALRKQLITLVIPFVSKSLFNLSPPLGHG
jgi:hypothetical protein